jgi:hypothetical protein
VSLSLIRKSQADATMVRLEKCAFERNTVPSRYLYNGNEIANCEFSEISAPRFYSDVKLNVDYDPCFQLARAPNLTTEPLEAVPAWSSMLTAEDPFFVGLQVCAGMAFLSNSEPAHVAQVASCMIALATITLQIRLVTSLKAASLHKTAAESDNSSKKCSVCSMHVGEFTGLCKLQILLKIDRAKPHKPKKVLGAGAIAGICVGLAGAVLFLCVAAILLLIRRQRRRRRGPLTLHPAIAAPASRPRQAFTNAGQYSSNPAPASPHVVEYPSIPNARAPPQAPEACKQVLPPPLINPQEYGGDARAWAATPGEAYSAWTGVHCASTSSGARTSTMGHKATCASGKNVPWASEIRTRTHDTFADMTKVQSKPLVPPGPGAGIEERLLYVHRQLDSPSGREVLQGLLLLEGPGNRLQGGVVPGSNMRVQRCSDRAYVYKAAPGHDASITACMDVRMDSCPAVSGISKHRQSCHLHCLMKQAFGAQL